MASCHDVPGDLPHHAGRGTCPLLMRSVAVCSCSSPPSRTQGRLPGLAAREADVKPFVAFHGPRCPQAFEVCSPPLIGYHRENRARHL